MGRKEKRPNRNPNPEKRQLSVCNIKVDNKKEIKQLDRIVRTMPPAFRTIVLHPQSGQWVPSLTPIGTLWLAEQLGGKYRDQVHAAFTREKQWQEERKLTLAKIEAHASRLPPKRKMPPESFAKLAKYCQRRLKEIKKIYNKRTRIC